MSLRRCRAGGDGKTGRSGSASGWVSKRWGHSDGGVGDDGNRPVGGRITLRLDDSGHITLRCSVVQSPALRSSRYFNH
ncbi:MAG: hypothetical protein LBD06_10955 [Candidatus Accumulibacter sp.]|nr:hypothetical protein [Accumulibacter sp.]